MSCLHVYKCVVCLYKCVCLCERGLHVPVCVSMSQSLCLLQRRGGAGGCQHPDWVNRCCLGFLVPGQKERSPFGGGVPAPPPTLLTLPALLQKVPSASDSDSKAESDAAKAEPVPPVRSPSSSSASSSSSSSDSEVSVKKPPRGRKPGRLAGAAAGGAWGWVGLGEALQEMTPAPHQIRASLLLFSFAAEKPPPKPRGRKPKPERPPTSSSSDRWVQGLGRGAGGGWVWGLGGGAGGGRVWLEAP